MTTLLQQIEELRLRVNETANSERTLVKVLGDALARTDEHLLQAVRNVASDHEGRRSVILQELYALAGRIGAFPVQKEQVALEEVSESFDEQRMLGPGDWRQAANNIQDDLDFRLNGHAAAH